MPRPALRSVVRRGHGSVPLAPPSRQFHPSPLRVAAANPPAPPNKARRQRQQDTVRQVESLSASPPQKDGENRAGGFRITKEYFGQGQPVKPLDARALAARPSGLVIRRVDEGPDPSRGAPAARAGYRPLTQTPRPGMPSQADGDTSPRPRPAGGMIQHAGASGRSSLPRFRRTAGPDDASERRPRTGGPRRRPPRGVPRDDSDDADDADFDNSPAVDEEYWKYKHQKEQEAWAAKPYEVIGDADGLLKSLAGYGPSVMTSQPWDFQSKLDGRVAEIGKVGDGRGNSSETREMRLAKALVEGRMVDLNTGDKDEVMRLARELAERKASLRSERTGEEIKPVDVELEPLSQKEREALMGGLVPIGGAYVAPGETKKGQEHVGLTLSQLRRNKTYSEKDRSEVLKKISTLLGPSRAQPGKQPAVRKKA